MTDWQRSDQPGTTPMPCQSQTDIGDGQFQPELQALSSSSASRRAHRYRSRPISARTTGPELLFSLSKGSPISVKANFSQNHKPRALLQPFERLTDIGQAKTAGLMVPPIDHTALRMSPPLKGSEQTAGRSLPISIVGSHSSAATI
jgi:hypothetical protein